MGGRGGFRLRLGATLATAACLLAATASPGAASVTIGQIADPSASSCDPGIDFAQGSVTSGNSYVVPGAGTITSWTMQASAAAGQQLSMKIYRKVGDPALYQVVGHAGPVTLTPGGTTGNTFPANVGVRPGDLLGLHTFTAASQCAFFPAAIDQILVSATNLADGASAPFTAEDGARLNIQAVFNPDNTVTLGAAKLNKKKGTATLTVGVPNPGDLTVTGKGIKGAFAGGAVISKTVGAGEVKLVIRASGKKRRALNENGKVKIKAKIRFTPTGGDAATRTKKLKLKRL